MVRLILEGLGALLIFIYLIIDVIIPAFSSWKFFWFTKSVFKSKPKVSFEQEYADAEKAYAEANEKWDKLRDTAGKEADKARENLSKAAKVYAEAVKKQQDPKNN